MRKLKVLLIQPPGKDCVKTLFSIYNAEEGIGLKPPMGLLYIGTSIKELTPHSVRILDCQLHDAHEGNILDFIEEPYDVVGISAWTDFWYQALEIAKKIKEKYPLCHIVMGGPHVGIFPHQTLSFEFIDSIVIGDGEYPMLKLLEYLSLEDTERTSLPELNGLYLRKAGRGEYLPYVCEDLDSLPIPDRTLLPTDKYYSVIGQSRYVTSMITSRGCPYRCVYCKLKSQKPVARSAENVVKEFEIIRDLGIKEVEVYDDTFNWDHRRTLDICSGMLNERIDVRWAIRDRADRVRDDALIALKKAGCYRIHLGVESGNDGILRAVKKNITVDQVRHAVGLIKKQKFILLTYFMYGLPGETVHDALETLKLALELDSDYAEFSIMIPYPGTEAYENALKEKVIPVDYWHRFALDPVPSFEIPYLIENLISKQELVRLRNLSVRKFYFRPRYILKEIVKVRTRSEFIRKVKMAAGLFDLLLGKDGRI